LKTNIPTRSCACRDEVTFTLPREKLYLFDTKTEERISS